MLDRVQVGAELAPIWLSLGASSLAIGRRVAEECCKQSGTEIGGNGAQIPFDVRPTVELRQEGPAEHTWWCQHERLSLGLSLGTAPKGKASTFCLSLSAGREARAGQPSGRATLWAQLDTRGSIDRRLNHLGGVAARQ